MVDRKAKRGELLRAFQARKGHPEYQVVVDLVEGLLEDTKQSLVTAAPDQFMLKQGEARAYDTLLKMLTRPALPANFMET